MAPRPVFNTAQIKDQARRDLLNLLEGVRSRHRPVPPTSHFADRNTSRRSAASSTSSSNRASPAPSVPLSRSPRFRSTASTSSSSWRMTMRTRASAMSSS
jgi:hypothetical protein